ALAAAAILLLVLQPAIQRRNVTRVPNHIAVLVDTSRSMSFRGQDSSQRGGITRWDRVRAILRASAGRLTAWAKHRRVDFFAFDEGLVSLGGPPPSSVRPRGRATHLRAALEALRRRYRGRDLAGAVILSDGGDNGRFGSLAQGALAFARSFDAPIHGLLVGAQHLRDVAIAKVRADDFAFVRNALQVEVDVVVQGVAPGTLLKVVLRQRPRRVVATKRVRVVAGKTRYTVTFDFVPSEVGRYAYDVSTPLLDGEALGDNNHRSFLLRVIRDRIRVLQVSGRPSWDERFLRRLLKRDPNVDLISFFILRTPASQALVSPAELSLIPFPTAELFEHELGSFDLVILQDFNFGPYGIGVYLPHLRRYVLKGGGLAMLGGDLSFSSGGYAQTPVAEVLPVTLLPGNLPPEALIDETDFRARLTVAGRVHPILQIGPDQVATAKLFASLPPLSGVNRVRGLAAGATSLLVHPRLKDEGGRALPVLAVRDIGKGRTLALMTDSLWQWAFVSLADAGGSRRAYDRFWRNALRWLIRDPELSTLRISLRRDRVAPKQEVAVTIRATHADYAPAKDLSITWEVEPLGDHAGVAATSKRGTTDAQGELHVAPKPSVSGVYRVRAHATIGGRARHAEALFVVQASGIEFHDPRAQPAVLRALAAASGGRFFEAPSALPDLSFNEPRIVRINAQGEETLWDTWWAFMLIVLVFSAEWVLRRRAGHL
ncbi:MAG: hypothetical protein KAI47_11040, partial [Deltaproteobacteria bacterium]|nr:hypothetical protein [Deltaproteobacteria bacterium]